MHAAAIRNDPRSGRTDHYVTRLRTKRELGLLVGVLGWALRHHRARLADEDAVLVPPVHGDVPPDLELVGKPVAVGDRDGVRPLDVPQAEAGRRTRARESAGDHAGQGDLLSAVLTQRARLERRPAASEERR